MNRPIRKSKIGKAIDSSCMKLLKQRNKQNIDLPECFELQNSQRDVNRPYTITARMILARLIENGYCFNKMHNF